MKKTAFVIMAFLLAVQCSFALSFRWAPNTDFRSPDKFAHFLAGNYLTSEFAQWGFAKGNRWVGFTVMSFAMDGVWEVKDGFVPYEKYGRIGAEGYDYKDVIANTLGGLYGVRLYDRLLMWSGFKEEAPIVFVDGDCKKPSGEIVPVIKRRLLYTGVYLLGCATYNQLYSGKPFPHRGEFKIDSRKAEFLETLNSESSFTLPWVMNSELREYFPLYIRYPAMLAAVELFEISNGTWDDRDVPWLGDKAGYKGGDVWTGVVSAHLVVVYDLLFYREDLACKIHYAVGPTSEGLGLVYADNSKVWTLSPRLSENELGVGFHLNW